jgi:hypothetical protein
MHKDIITVTQDMGICVRMGITVMKVHLLANIIVHGAIKDL